VTLRHAQREGDDHALTEATRSVIWKHKHVYPESTERTLENWLPLIRGFPGEQTVSNMA
jgi:hypothetical protein